MNLKVRTLVAFAFAALASTLSAPAALAAGHHHHHAVDRASYPMKADEFRQLMEKRIDHVRAAIDRKLNRRGVSPERKKAIHKIFDEETGEVRAEMARAAAKGTVSHADAEKVKTLASGLRTRVRERLRAERDPKYKARLARRDAKRKEHAAHEAAEEAARKKEEQANRSAAPKGAKATLASHDSGHHAKPAGDAPKSPKATARAEGAAKPRGAKAAKASAHHDKGPTGPTRTAKMSAPKKQAHPKEDPGADL